MHIEDFRDYCLAKKGVTEEFPFDKHTLVFKVMGKMFALTSLNSQEFKVNLKCDPELAVALREEYEEVQPGFHMSKIHWNTVHFEGNLSDEMLLELIDHSYDLIVSKLPKKVKKAMDEMK